MSSEIDFQSILMTTDTVGGVWAYSMTLARELGCHDVQVYLATMGAPLSRSQRREAATVNNLRIFESDYRLEWMDEPWEDVRKAGAWLRSLERRLSPDVIHLNGYSYAASHVGSWSRPVLVVGHSCVLSWWQAVKGEDAPASWSRYREEVTAGLAAADAVVAPSRAMIEALRLVYGIPFEGAVIPNACDPSHYIPGRKEPMVFSAGRLWDEAKNIVLLDRIANRVSWPVYVAGHRCHPNGNEASLAGAHALGQLAPELAREWYARASIYVLPAKYEPFGLSVLEAALSGCALVLGDIASLRENWDGAAVFVDTNDADALLAAIEKLIADEPFRVELGTLARARGIAFSPQRMGDGYMSAYRKLIAARQLNLCA